MAITLTGASGLFTRMGLIFHALNTLNTARLTTVPAQVNDVITEMDGDSEALRAAIEAIPDARDAWRLSGDPLAESLRQSAENLLIQMVEDDNPQEELSLAAALAELIEQMVGTSDDVDASTVAATITAGSANAGNGTFLASTKRGDGLINENLLGESIVAVSDDGGSFQFKGEVARDDRLSEYWPDGSGCDTAVEVAALDNLLTNGGFEEADSNQTTKPADWIVHVGTLGTTLKMTSVEVQTVAISGTPASGSYVLHFTNGASKVQTTDSLVWNATSTQVQAALRALTGLEEITVVESGTTPNLTHTITFTGVTAPAELTSTSRLNTGSIAHATTTAGSANVYSGARALEFDSDGSQLTEIRQRLDNLTAETQYAVNLMALHDVDPAAGVFTVDLYDGSAIINDQAGTANSFTFNAGDLTTSMAARNGFFRTPRILPPIVYLRIRISTGVSSGSSVFIDHVQMVEATPLYEGGPEVAILAGSTPFQALDTASIAATNNRAGAFQEWFDRAFDMKGLGLLLPSDTGGTETVDDALIA